MNCSRCSNATTRDSDLAVAVFDLNFAQTRFIEELGELTHQFQIDLHDTT